MNRFSVAIALVAGVWLAAAKAAQAAPCLIVMLKGTQGGPGAFNGLAGRGTLVRYGDDGNNCGAMNLQFDAGRGTTTRLAQLGVTAGHLDAIFFTHMHSDHTDGFADIMQVRWHFESARPKLNVVCSADTVSVSCASSSPPASVETGGGTANRRLVFFVLVAGRQQFLSVKNNRTTMKSRWNHRRRSRRREWLDAAWELTNQYEAQNKGAAKKGERGGLGGIRAADHRDIQGAGPVTPQNCRRTERPENCQPARCHWHATSLRNVIERYSEVRGPSAASGLGTRRCSMPWRAFSTNDAACSGAFTMLTERSGRLVVMGALG